MGSRTGKEPSSDDTFLWRICHALDEPPRMLAYNIGVPFGDLEPLLDPRHHLIEMDYYYVWAEIEKYVSNKLGHLLAIKMEMGKALQTDKTKRLLRVNKQRDYYDWSDQ